MYREEGSPVMSKEGGTWIMGQSVGGSLLSGRTTPGRWVGNGKEETDS